MAILLDFFGVLFLGLIATVGGLLAIGCVGLPDLLRGAERHLHWIDGHLEEMEKLIREGNEFLREDLQQPMATDFTASPPHLFIEPTRAEILSHFSDDELRTELERRST